MKATELRIGNYVNADNVKYHPKVTKDKTTLKIVGVSMNPSGYSIQLNTLNVASQIVNPYMSQLIMYIKPVKLTEEWLFKFGFIIDEFISYRWYLDTKHLPVELIYDLDDNDVCISDCWTYNKVKYVHQLQNLYFALVGEELTINQ